jgi:hypothetical protein
MRLSDVFLQGMVNELLVYALSTYWLGWSWVMRTTGCASLEENLP